LGSITYSYFFILFLVGAIGPEIAFDTLLYHLTIAKQYSIFHNLHQVNQQPQSIWQLNSELQNSFTIFTACHFILWMTLAI